MTMNRIKNLPDWAVILLGLSLLAPIWTVDRSVTWRVSLSIFYLIPISLVAWLASARAAFLMAAVAAMAWLNADIAAGHEYRHWLVPYWNAAVRLGFFIIVAWLAAAISRLRKLNDEERTTSELKSGMMSLVSHEFGNSLAIMQLSLILLRESETGEPPERRQQCYETLERTFARLKNATDNFLNLNRLDSGRFRADFGRTLIRDLIHETVAALRPLIANKDVRLELDFPPAPAPVRADANALSLVMSNLIGNALKYTPAGGTVTIRITPKGEQTLIEVQDTGIGIPKADQERIFAGFVRAEKGKQTAKGFGVGLKVSHDLLEGMDSKLEVASEPGKGSRFFFALPTWR